MSASKGYSCERNLRSTNDDTFNIDIFLKGTYNSKAIYTPKYFQKREYQAAIMGRGQAGGAGALAASLVTEGLKLNTGTATTLLQGGGADHALGVISATTTTATLRTVIRVLSSPGPRPKPPRPNQG